MQTLGFLGNIHGFEWLVILVIGLLIFGRRLPEVGRSLGRGIVEFRKGIKGIEDEVESETSRPVAAPVTRPPLTAGADVRVSKADVVEATEVRPAGGGAAS
jgi:sec-independent protein translocase protein TatA